MPPMRAVALLTAALIASACARPAQIPAPAPVSAAPAPAIASTAALIDAMHDRYAGRWYRNLTFVQTSSFYKPDGSLARQETWYEAAAVPGRLRIDLGDPSHGNAALYANDSIYSFQGGKLAAARKGRNELMILGFDVYGQPAARSLAMLGEEGFDTSKFHEATVDGTRYYVVGAAPGDSTTRQFWVDANDLLFWRIREPWSATDSTHVREIRFQNYVPHDGGWLAEQVVMLRDGQRVFQEDYADVQVNRDLDPLLWDPTRFYEARRP